MDVLSGEEFFEVRMQFGFRAELIPPGLGLFLIEVADCSDFHVGSSEVCTEMRG
jgi:hypothetical protein